MSRLDDNRLFSWNVSIEKRAAAVRSSRLSLEDRKAVCIQLEASLVELANENDATERMLTQKEQYIASRRTALDHAATQCNARRSLLDGERKKTIIEVERMENTLENEWRGFENEEEAAELEHQQRISLIQQQLEELRKQEGDLIESLRQLHDTELKIDNQRRQLKQKEDQLKLLSEGTLRHLKAELRERETFLNQ